MRVRLEDMLAARDRRVEIQNKMLKVAYGSQDMIGEHEVQDGREDQSAPVNREAIGRLVAGGKAFCVVCLTMNIAGDVKRTAMIRMLFDHGIEEFEKLGFDVLKRVIIDEKTGCEAFWLLREDAAAVKGRTEKIEDGFPAGRLFDFDVLEAAPAAESELPFLTEGSFFYGRGGAAFRAQKLSRSESRRCLVCGRAAADCAGSRRHGLGAVKDATAALLRSFCASLLASYAHEALLSELATSPKPGLVDMNNCGSHPDMDAELFRKSADALLPYFSDAAALGLAGCGMAELRSRGVAAEKEMFAATGGVNTHKGLIYSMGLLLAGMGRALSEEHASPSEVISPDRSLSALQDPLLSRAVFFAAELAREDADDRLESSRRSPATNGAAVLRDHGAKGATGQAAAGFPDAVFCAERLLFYSNETSAYSAGQISAGAPSPDPGFRIINIPAALALCDSMARLEDTNLLHRGGREGLEYVKSRAAAISALPAEERIPALYSLDSDLIERNLSPGGSADMLALAFLLKAFRCNTGLFCANCQQKTF